MRNYSDLNPQEQIHYASAAQLTSIHYLYPLMLQDLTGTEDLEQKYLRVISKVQLSYKSPYGLKANLKKLSQAINEQKPKRDYFTLPPDHPLETIESVLSIATSRSICWLSPSLWDIGHSLCSQIIDYCQQYPEYELKALSQTFGTIHEWYYQGLTGQVNSKTDYLFLIDVPQTIGRSNPIILATNPEPEHLKKFADKAQVLSRFINQ